MFRSAGCEIIRTPFRAPQANGVAERFVRTVRSECLDWLLILNERHLKHVLADFVAHYDGDRPHRALGLKPPHPTRSSVVPAAEQDEIRVERRDRLGGLVHEYSSQRDRGFCTQQAPSSRIAISSSRLPLAEVIFPIGPNMPLRLCERP